MDRPLVLAHRGARRRAPENTLEAFAVARDLGADGVELDVHRTADGALVVHHDAAVRPRARVLATLDHRRGPAERFPTIPTLAEALDVCAGLLVNIEIKNLPWDRDFDADERVADDVVGAPRGTGTARDRVLVSSFDLATVDRVRAATPEVPHRLPLPRSGCDLLEVVDLRAPTAGTSRCIPTSRALGRTGGAGRVIARAHDARPARSTCGR